MAEKRFKSLKEFYPYYLTEHADPTCRTFHFIGTTGVFVFLILAIATQTWWMLALIPVCGYGFAWAGHAIFAGFPSIESERLIWRNKILIR